jgi:hypothetical protein
MNPTRSQRPIASALGDPFSNSIMGCDWPGGSFEEPYIFDENNEWQNPDSARGAFGWLETLFVAWAGSVELPPKTCKIQFDTLDENGAAITTLTMEQMTGSELIVTADRRIVPYISGIRITDLSDSGCSAVGEVRKLRDARSIVVGPGA